MKKLIDAVRKLFRPESSAPIFVINNVPYDRPIPFNPEGMTWEGKGRGLPPPPIIWYGEASDPPRPFMDTKARH